MKKKILALLLVVTLCLSMCFVLIACNKTDDSGAEKGEDATIETETNEDADQNKIVSEKVTKEEWCNALEFKGVESVTEKMISKSGNAKLEKIVKVDHSNGAAYTKIINTIAGEVTEDEFYGENGSSLYTELYAYLMRNLELSDYSNFKYDEDKKGYYYSTVMAGVRFALLLKFVDKKIVYINLNQGGGIVEYSYYDYNKTVVKIPDGYVGEEKSLI